MRDEARVRRTAAGGKLRPAAGHILNRLRDQLGEWTGLGDEDAGIRRLPLEREGNIAAGRFRRALLDQRLQRVERMAIVEADVEACPRLAGNEVDGLVADVDRREFEMRGRELDRKSVV